MLKIKSMGRKGSPDAISRRASCWLDFGEDPDVNRRINLSDLKVQIQQAMPGIFTLRLREVAGETFYSMLLGPTEPS